MTHVQKVAPDFVPTPKGEPKIGPKLKNASAAFEARRADREKTVHGIRDGEKSLQMLDAKILDGKTAYAIDQHRAAFERLTPNQHPKARATIRLHISKPNKDGSPKTMKQILDDVGRAIAHWLKAQTVELERMAQEAQQRAMEAEKRRLAAHGGIPSPFAFSPSSSWGRAAQAQTATVATTSTRHKP